MFKKREPWYGKNSPPESKLWGVLLVVTLVTTVWALGSSWNGDDSQTSVDDPFW